MQDFDQEETSTAIKTPILTGGSTSRGGLFIGSITSIALSLALLLIIVDGEGLVHSQLDSMWLLLLAILLAIISLVPAVASMRSYTSGWDLFHPLFYAAWFFFIPQFAVASFMIVFGGLEISASRLLPAPWSPRIKAIEYTILASIGLTLGYISPAGRHIGRLLSKLKGLDIPSEKIKLTAYILLILGFFAQLGSFRSGLLGYQFYTNIPVFGALFASFSSVAVIGQGIVWYSYFQKRQGWRFLALICIGLVIFEVIISGNRGTLFHSLLIIVAGYQYAKKDAWKLRNLWKWGALIVVSIIIGMSFGTYFRQLKSQQFGRVDNITLQEAVSLSADAMDTVGEQPFSELVEFAYERIIERIDGVTSLAVILSRNAQVRSLEIAAGIDQNITRDFLTAFVPRFLWPAKPIVGGHEQIGNIYFGTQYHSPAVTYMGDLYRNFGVLGIIPGMFILGIALRSLYRWLIEGQSTTPMRVGLFLSLGFLVNYEGLYSVYFPALIREILIVLMVIVLARVLSKVSFKRLNDF